MRRLRSSPAISERAYWEARLGADFSLASVGWLGLGLLFNRALYRQRELVLDRALRRFEIEPRGSHILELGPGTGFYVAHWKRMGVASLVGLDITSVAVGRLTAEYPGFRFAVADVGEDLSPSLVPLASFDIVTAFDVLFHIRDDERFARAIESAARALRPGGFLLATDLFLHGQEFEGAHQKSRTLGAYEAALAANGLRILGRLPVFVLMHPALDLPAGRRRDLALRWWSWLSRRAKRRPQRIGWLVALLAPAERALTRVLSDGPTTELLVAQKPSDDGEGPNAAGRL